MKSRIPILLNIYRGGAAIILGILLLFMPDQSRDNLFNLMGIFWLSIGFAFLRRSQDDERYPGKHTALIAGLVVFVTGLLVVTRRFTLQWVAEDVIFFVLGTVILTTGLVHMYSEHRIGGITTNRQTGIHFLLGLFEVLLGGLLILSPRMNRPIVYWAAAAWALIYGVMSLGMAVHQIVRSKQEETGPQSGSESAQKPG
jgi:uncharacterized membrane protein HdeD (DUF308 family)